MRRLVETSHGTVLIERNGPYGTVNTFASDGWENREIIFKGQDELRDGLQEIGLEAVDAAEIASDYWTTWDSRFSDPYYLDARRTMHLVMVWAVGVAIVVVGAIAVALWLILR